MAHSAETALTDIGKSGQFCARQTGACGFVVAYFFTRAAVTKEKEKPMKNLMMASLALAPFFVAPAFASVTEDHCIALTEAEGLGSEACACVGEVGDANPGVEAEVLALSSTDEANLMSDATKEALAVCFPQG